MGFKELAFDFDAKNGGRIYTWNHRNYLSSVSHRSPHPPVKTDHYHTLAIVTMMALRVLVLIILPITLQATHTG
eukprot:scaffold28190_cov70-Cyclotella_meneghiniana.AAC.4